MSEPVTFRVVKPVKMFSSELFPLPEGPIITESSCALNSPHISLRIFSPSEKRCSHYFSDRDARNFKDSLCAVRLSLSNRIFTPSVIASAPVNQLFKVV